MHMQEEMRPLSSRGMVCDSRDRLL